MKGERVHARTARNAGHAGCRARRAQNAGGGRISGNDVVIGHLSSTVGESVQFYFDVLSRDTAATGAESRLRRERARAACSTCGSGYEVSPPLDPTCALCGALTLSVTGGREFYIESIEVEE